MIRFSIIFLIILFLNASIIDDYKNKNYNKICNYKTLDLAIKNEQLLSIVGMSCVKSNNLYLLPYIVKNLKNSPISRKNAIYFLVIYSEKKLLYSFLFDNFDISSFSFPRTNYILSIVFEAIKNKNYTLSNGIYLIKYKNRIIKMYKEDSKMIIENKNERYWFR